MAKLLFALCLVGALVVAANAASHERKLQQIPCDQLKEIQGKCCELCNCVAAKNSALKNAKGACISQCNTCINGGCKDGKLTDTCAKGVGPFMGAIQGCVGEYRGNPKKALETYKC
jgi:hypothetical protein